MKNFFKTIKKILFLLEKPDKKKLVSLFGFMILCSILEMGGVGLIVPFVSIISDPEIIQRNQVLGKLYFYTHAESPKEFLIFMSLGLMGFYIIKNLSLGLMNYSQSRFIFTKRSISC